MLCLLFYVFLFYFCYFVCMHARYLRYRIVWYGRYVPVFEYHSGIKHYWTTNMSGTEDTD